MPTLFPPIGALDRRTRGQAGLDPAALENHRRFQRRGAPGTFDPPSSTIAAPK
jgi:hypothetical protein